jgi:dihydrofolate reductase
VRELKYSIASSLDGYIAGVNGEYDWIVVDPDIDFAALYASFSGVVMGRRSYEVFKDTGGGVGPPLPTYVCSRSLPEGDREGVTFVHDAVAHIKRLKADGSGKPLWLWGGADLFSQLAAADLVDSIEVAIVPVLLGSGLPMAAAAAPRLALKLRSHQLFAKTGTLWVTYDVQRGVATEPAPR